MRESTRQIIEALQWVIEAGGGLGNSPPSAIPGALEHHAVGEVTTPCLVYPRMSVSWTNRPVGRRGGQPYPKNTV